jgi:hypothetical protein
MNLRRKRTRYLAWIGFFLLTLGVSAPLWAQDEEGGGGGGSGGEDPAVIYKAKTTYNFEDDTITGDLTRPDQEFVSGRKGSALKSLIKIRENFRDKVLQSAKDL